MRVYCFPDSEHIPNFSETLKNMKEGDDIYMFGVPEVWIIDLETCTMYIGNSENPKIIKLKPIFCDSLQGTKKNE